MLSQVDEDGGLQIEQAAESDSGFYQCLLSNEHGSAVYTYHVSVLVYQDAPYQPVITNASLVDDRYISVQWTSCNKPQFPIIAFTFVYVEEVCLPHILSLSKVSGWRIHALEHFLFLFESQLRNIACPMWEK